MEVGEQEDWGLDYRQVHSLPPDTHTLHKTAAAAAAADTLTPSSLFLCFYYSHRSHLLTLFHLHVTLAVNR